MASTPPPVGGTPPIQPSREGPKDLRQQLLQAIQSFTRHFREPRPSASDLAPTITTLANRAQEALKQRGS